MADDLRPADDLVWPPPDEELDALTPLPLPSSVAAPNLPDAAAEVTIPVDAPPVPVGAADFAERHVAGDVVLRTPPSTSRVGPGTGTLVFLAVSLLLGYTVAAQFWP